MRGLLRSGALVLAGCLIVASPFAAPISAKPRKPAKSAPIPGLLVSSGESWVFKIEAGQPVSARKVATNDMPSAGEIKVSIDGQSGTTMTIINNTPLWYDYTAYLVDKPGKRGTGTSVCTLMGGGRSAFENWPQGIAAIRISDFKPAQGEQVVCH